MKKREITICLYQNTCLTISDKNKEIERLNNIINKAINILELSAMNKGICTRLETDTIQSALLVLKGSDKE